MKQISFTYKLNEMTGAISNEVSVGITVCIIAFNCICVIVTAVLTIFRTFQNSYRMYSVKSGFQSNFYVP